MLKNSKTKFNCYTRAILEIKIHKKRLNVKGQNNVLLANINQKNGIEKMLLSDKM